MTKAKVANALQEIDVDLIDRNPENPRLVFRPDEMSLLMESIRKLGVQVPIAVYREGKKYVLIDGERRWKCSIKLNKRTIPAIIQDKPDALNNLLLMFNIHALREQWDLLTIAMKLPRIIDFLRAKSDREVTEREISGETGLSIGVVRRCKLLIELPDTYQQTILMELQKPKSQQKLTEDFFIEMERSLKTVVRAMPELVEKYPLDRMREVLITKYQNGTIKNLIHFRQLGKIARARNVEADVALAQGSLVELFKTNKVSIEDAYNRSVSTAYGERDLITRVHSLAEQLSTFDAEDFDDDVIEELRDLYGKLSLILEGK